MRRALIRMVEVPIGADYTGGGGNISGGGGGGGCLLFGFGMAHRTACKSRSSALRLVLGVRTIPHHQIIKI